MPVLTKLGGDRDPAPGGDRRAATARATRSSTTSSTRPVLAWKADHETRGELERQRAEADRRHRRLLVVIAAGAVALLAMAAITVFALAQRHDARQQAQAAGRASGSASAGTGGPRKPARGAGRQSAPDRPAAEPAERARLGSRAPVGRGADALRQALVVARERAILPSRGAVNSVAFSPGRLPSAHCLRRRRGAGLVAADGRGTRFFRRRGVCSHGRLQPRRQARSSGSRRGRRSSGACEARANRTCSRTDRR